MNLSPKTLKTVRGIVDYGGLVVFLAAYFITGRDMVQATWALVGGSGLALLIGFVVERRVAPLPLISGGAALVFGTLTLVFNNAMFIKIKPTVMNLAFGLALFGGLILKKNPLKLLLGEAITLPDRAWRTLTINYALFFFFVAGLNEVVWRTQPDSTWVVFRFPGLLILSVIFSLTQVPLMMKHAVPPAGSGDQDPA
jgi:intracellular septation protein